MDFTGYDEHLSGQAETHGHEASGMGRCNTRLRVNFLWELDRLNQLCGTAYPGSCFSHTD